jgi:hypothetical protein
MTSWIYISKKELIGAGVLAVVLSPLLVVGWVGFGIYAAGSKIHQKAHKAKLRKAQQARIDAALFPDYKGAPPEADPHKEHDGAPSSPTEREVDPELVKAVHQLYDTALEKKDAASYLALGAGMFFQEDFGAAYYYFSLGLSVVHTLTGDSMTIDNYRVYAYFYRGLAAQHLANFKEAVESFELAPSWLSS